MALIAVPCRAASGVSPVMLQNLAAAHQAGTLPPELLAQLQEMVAVAKQQQPPTQHYQGMPQQHAEQQQQLLHGAGFPQQQQQQGMAQHAQVAGQGRLGDDEEPHPFLRIQQSSMEEDEAALPEHGSMSNLLNELRKDSLDMGSIPSAALPSVLLHQLANSKSAQLRQQHAPHAAGMRSPAQQGAAPGTQRGGDSGVKGDSQQGGAGGSGGGPVMVGAGAGAASAGRPPIGPNGVAPLPSMGELPMLSSDLEKFLIADNMETSLQGAFPSSIFSAAGGMGGASKGGGLQSLELPGSITVALHGFLGGSHMQGDGQGHAGGAFGGGGGGGGAGGAFGGGAKFVGGSFPQGGGQQLHGRNSGLDCMQSIEVALPTITSGDAASLMLHHMQQELPEMQQEQQ